MSNKLLTWKQRRAEIKETLAALNEKAAEQQRDFDEAEQAKWDDLTAESKRLSKQIERYDAIDGMPNMPDVREAAKTPEAPVFHQRPTPDNAQSIYVRYLRTGDDSAGREADAAARDEYRASNDTTMNITTDADGGYLVPTGHYNGIIQKARDANLMDIMGVRDIPGTGTTTNVPVDDEGDSGVFVSTAESTAFDRDTPAVNQVALTLVKYTKKVDLTYELLQDEESRLLNFIEFYVAAGYAATHNYLGFTEALANGTAALSLDSATAIDEPEVPELIYKIPDAYAQQGNLVINMERATEGYLRGLQGNNLVFTPTPAGMPRPQSSGDFMGLPCYTNSNMGTLEASGKSMMVANWNYMLRYMAPGMTVLRDPYTRSSYGEVIINYYFRCDYGVAQAAAFQYATHPTG